MCHQFCTCKNQSPKDKYAGIVYIDGFTELHNIPPKTGACRFGNRGAFKWILTSTKKKPGDPTIASLFNTYRFKDYKAQVIELLKKVCTVRVDAVKVVRGDGEGIILYTLQCKYIVL